jgi:O-acetyl-ADP-ribose deacetylase (regulator of RNase III)
MREKMTQQQKVFSVNNKELIVTMTPWTEVNAEALVLSANNHLVLNKATGHADWLYIQCPAMHDEIQKELKEKETKHGRGLLPGDGLITFGGPNNRAIIHAVSVDYKQSGSQHGPYAGIDTVAAATLFALEKSEENKFKSVAFYPMCTRGHANATLPRRMAKEVLPKVLAQTIFGKVLVSDKSKPDTIIIAAYNEKNNELAEYHFRIVANEWEKLYQKYCK